MRITENGVRITGAYIGTQTKRKEVEEFVINSLSENGDNHLLCVDLNAMNFSWDS